MDDTSPKPPAPQSNIDDLVKELSRPQNPPPPPAGGFTPLPAAGSAPQPPSLVLPPSTPPRPISPPPVPALPPSAPKPNPVPVPSVPLATAPNVPKEYQSSIRTMSDDLSKLKAGQQPQGVNIPRKIDTTLPPTGGSVPVVPTTPLPAPQKIFSSSTLPPSIKSAPMAPNQAPKTVLPAPISRPTPPPMATMPAPSKSSDIKPDTKNQFYVPPVTSPPSSNGRNLIFIGVAVAAVLFGIGYWYFMIRGDQVAVESPIPTFTPRPTATPNPDVLGIVFPTRGGTIVLPSSGDPAVAFKNALSAQPNINPGTLTAVDIVSSTSSTSVVQPLNISGLLDRFLVPYPPELKATLGQNFKILLYGQKESFDTKGRSVTNTATGPRLVLVNEITSSPASILEGWEPSMSTHLSGVMMITPSKNTGPFTVTSYQGASVRFKNFPYHDYSIDYSLLQYNGKTYFIMAGSRESMFATIDAFITSVPGK